MRNISIDGKNKLKSLGAYKSMFVAILELKMKKDNGIPPNELDSN